VTSQLKTLSIHDPLTRFLVNHRNYFNCLLRLDWLLNYWVKSRTRPIKLNIIYNCRRAASDELTSSGRRSECK